MSQAPRQRLYTYLVVVEPGRPKRILVWDTQDLSVGRAPENDLRLDYDELSRRHVLFSRMDDAYLVKDLGTSNGTHLNGRLVEVHKLANEDVVGLAGVEITFHRSPRNPATLGDKVEFASQLKAFGGAAGAGPAPDATMLGLNEPLVLDSDEEMDIRPAGEFDPREVEEPRAPRNLDLELDDGAPGLADLDLEPPAAAEPEGGKLTLEISGLDESRRRALRELLGGIDWGSLRIRLK